ncbi:hypothetical protein SDC9_191282 [bioreactor metagenome]|uniref:Uncharacterized protein n=1 Tax=bioreactor metagenome TaxID=1076179 RepID=A0A645HZ10_9ZZZZ
MGVPFGSPVAGEVLEAGQHPLVGKASGHPQGHVRHQLAVRPKGAVPNDRVAGVCQHVGVGGKVQVQPIFPQVAADGRPHLIGLLHIPLGPNVRHGRELWQGKIPVVPQAGHRAALLVHGQQQRHPLGFLGVPLGIFGHGL